MTEEEFKKILDQLANHEARLNVLEKSIMGQIRRVDSGGGKQKTLREIVKGRKFKNGQEQVAIIVGYHEKIIGILINKDNIKSEWINAKITNKYSPNFIDRAKDVFIRIHPNGTCDLTQLGEEFFENFLKNEPSQKASK